MSASWRPMLKTDLGGVTAVADQVHPAFPEDWAIFAERLHLYPQGCHVLAEGDVIRGYLLSHPWALDSLPKLNTPLEQLPKHPGTYYVHDIAILAEARGTGAAATAVEYILDHARKAGFMSVTLVAVNNSGAFWRTQGFEKRRIAALTPALASYGASAALMQRIL